MIFDTPSLLRIWTLATVGPLIAVAVLRALFHWQTPRGWDAVYFYTALWGAILGGWLVISAWVSRMYAEYIRNDLLSKSDEPVRPKPAYRNEPMRIPNMNEKPLYNQVTPLVKIDHMSRKIKHFCIVLITQRDDGFKVDLKEDTWKAHFGGRDNYVWVRDVKMGNAFAKEFPRDNSPFTVTDWRIVEAGAEGRL